MVKWDLSVFFVVVVLLFKDVIIYMAYICYVMSVFIDKIWSILQSSRACINIDILSVCKNIKLSIPCYLKCTSTQSKINFFLSLNRITGGFSSYVNITKTEHEIFNIYTKSILSSHHAKKLLIITPSAAAVLNSTGHSADPQKIAPLCCF